MQGKVNEEELKAYYKRVYDVGREMVNLAIRDNRYIKVQDNWDYYVGSGPNPINSVIPDDGSLYLETDFMGVIEKFWTPLGGLRIVPRNYEVLSGNGGFDKLGLTPAFIDKFGLVQVDDYRLSLCSACNTVYEVGKGVDGQPFTCNGEMPDHNMVCQFDRRGVKDLWSRILPVPGVSLGEAKASNVPKEVEVDAPWMRRV